MSEGPTPDDAAELADELEAIMNALDDRKRKTLELRLQGKSLAEIAQVVGRSQRTVRRALDDIEQSMEQRLVDVKGE